MVTYDDYIDTRDDFDFINSLEAELDDLHREREIAHDAGDTEAVLELERQIRVLEDQIDNLVLRARLARSLPPRIGRV